MSSEIKINICLCLFDSYQKYKYIIVFSLGFNKLSILDFVNHNRCLQGFIQNLIPIRLKLFASDFYSLNPWFYITSMGS